MNAEEARFILHLLDEKEERIWEWEVAGFRTCISEDGTHSSDENHAERTCEDECACEDATCDTEACDEFRTQFRAIDETHMLAKQATTR